MGKLFTLISIAVFVLGLVIGEMHDAFCQETSTDEFTLEEITVTAQKRAEDSQKVPIALSTISGDELTEMGGTTLKDTLNTLTAVTIMQVNEGLNVSIRGMDNDGMPGDSAGMVGINLDGVASNNFATGYSGLYDVSRVEVLSGPQGTLYSRNSGGGVVNMVTNDPNMNNTEASGSVEIGNYNTLNTQGALNVPFTEKSAIRLAFATTDRDGYISNGTDDNDSKSMRLKYLNNFSDSLSLILTYENTRTSGKGQGRDGVKTFEDEEDTDNPWAANYDGKYFYNDINSDKFVLNMTWDTGIGTLTFLPSYTDLKRTFGTPGINMQTKEAFQNDCIDTEKEMSGELRMNSSADSFTTWVIGVYYYKKKWDDVSVSVSSNNINKTNNPTHAAFANLTYPVSDRFRVTGGGRYTKDHERMIIFNYDPTDGEVMQDENYDINHSHFDYKLGVEYDLSEYSMLWAENSTGYRQGYRGGKSQTLDAYQIGAKNRVMEQKLQVNATAYYYDYSNFQVNSMLTYIDEDGYSQMDPGSGTGAAIVYGLDLDTQFLLTWKDQITLAVSYLHSAISDLTIVYDYNPPSSIYKDAPLNNSPEWTVNMGYKHSFFLANGGTLTPNINIKYRNEYFCSFSDYTNDPDDQVNLEPAHHMTDVSLNYGSPSGKWSLNAYMKNLENHAEKVGKMMDSLRLSPPRTYGVVMSLKY